ncbi:MAG: hypothetical protein P8P26_03405 [Porticoccaceae bacterium]|nr:hypothetical protein [Porticoccaceae bacterium]
MTSPSQQEGKQRLIIGGLLLLVVLVVLLLPNFVSDPWIADPSASEKPVAVKVAVSPSTAAEKTKYRQDSQKVLAQIIAVRDELKEQTVEFWGDFEFRQAIALVDQGDEQYGYGDYREALASYQDSLNQLQALEQTGQTILEAALIEGISAIENAQITDIVLAHEASATAMAIAPEDSRSQQLSQRAEQLESLITALDNGQQRVETNELAAAKAYFQQAVSIDNQHQKAAVALKSVNQAITEQRFRGHMSDGFGALDRNQFDAATTAFNLAAKVNNNHSSPAQALSQVETKRSQLAVSNQMHQAAEFERNEQWQQALILYQELLQTDPSLTEAKVRTIPVSVRAALNNQLESVLADPLKLSAASNYQSAQRLLKDASGIASPGPVLKQQVADLSLVLQQSRTPVDVVLQSNSLTEVTLFRVAKLGVFEQTSLKLKPGRYIVAGSRMGYRDVRVEFTITGAPIDAPIRVSCDELI